MPGMTKLRELREDRLLSVEELAEEAGISKWYVYALESGRRRNPSSQVLIAICQALDVPLRSIVDDE